MMDDEDLEDLAGVDQRIQQDLQNLSARVEEVQAIAESSQRVEQDVADLDVRLRVAMRTVCDQEKEIKQLLEERDNWQAQYEAGVRAYEGLDMARATLQVSFDRLKTSHEKADEELDEMEQKCQMLETACNGQVPTGINIRAAVRRTELAKVRADNLGLQERVEELQLINEAQRIEGETNTSSEVVGWQRECEEYKFELHETRKLLQEIEGAFAQQQIEIEQLNAELSIVQEDKQILATELLSKKGGATDPAAPASAFGFDATSGALLRETMNERDRALALATDPAPILAEHTQRLQEEVARLVLDLNTERRALQEAETALKSEKKRRDEANEASDKLKGMVDRLSAEVARVESARQDLATEKTNLKEALEASQDHLERAAKAHLEEQKVTTSLREERATALRECSRWENEFNTAAGRVQALEREALTRASELGRAQEDAETAKKEVARLRETLQAERTSADKLEAAHAHADASSRARQREVLERRAQDSERFEKEAGTLRTSLEEAHATSRRSMREASALSIRVHELENDLVAAHNEQEKDRCAAREAKRLAEEHVPVIQDLEFRLACADKDLKKCKEDLAASRDLLHSTEKQLASARNTEKSLLEKLEAAEITCSIAKQAVADITEKLQDAEADRKSAAVEAEETRASLEETAAALEEATEKIDEIMRSNGELKDELAATKESLLSTEQAKVQMARQAQEDMRVAQEAHSALKIELDETNGKLTRSLDQL